MVLDSWALLAYFEGEEAGARVKEILKEAAESERDLLISVINWGEILTIIESRHGKEKRNEVERLMSQMHLEVIDAEKELTREAARLKANYNLPYVDCFVAALAKIKKSVLVTGDKDFKAVEGELKISWL